jgi:hypothetical protein
MPSPDQLPGRTPGFIPIENVGVRLSGRRPGERRLNLLRPIETEQPKTLLQEMQQYMTHRQQLREEGSLQSLVEQSYSQFVERSQQRRKEMLDKLHISNEERANLLRLDKKNIEDAYKPLRENAPISLADATHNDLYAIGIDDILPDNARAVMTKGNTAMMLYVFNAYAIGKYSTEKKKEVLASEEEKHRIGQEPRYRHLMPIIRLTPAETETVSWLLARIGIPFEAPPEGFKESDASLLLRMRSVTAEHQQQWTQERKPEGKVYQIRRRLKA